MERKGPNPPNPNRARQPNGTRGPLGPGGRYGYRKDFLREEAEKRQEARNARTPEQQLALLDSRLGVGKGARKERERLHAVIEERRKKGKKESKVEAEVD